MFGNIIYHKLIVNLNMDEFGAPKIFIHFSLFIHLLGLPNKLGTSPRLAKQLLQFSVCKLIGGYGKA